MKKLDVLVVGSGAGLQVASFAMATSSVSVVSNSLLLKKYRI